MREFFRELLSANLFITGIILTLAAFAIFYGSIYLLLYTNNGRRLGLLLAGAGIFGWLTISSMLFVIYAPADPGRPTSKGSMPSRFESSRSPTWWSRRPCSPGSWWRSSSMKSWQRGPLSQGNNPLGGRPR